jgi:hypothetical protein
VEFHHSRRTQTFRLKWIKTGFGYPRPAFICTCGRPVIKLYFRYANMACRRCCNATYASQTLDKNTRPFLQLQRLETFLYFKPRLRKHTIERLRKRYGDKVLMPQTMYGSHAKAHWR